MSCVERRFLYWVDLVDHLLSCPEGSLPTAELTAELADTFETSASWNWADADGGYGFEMLDQPPGWPTETEVEFWTHEAMPQHPLILWFAVTGDSAAMTIGRVPNAVGTRRGRELVTECLAPVGLDEQLSIPYQLSPHSYRAFVMGTTGTDYTDEQVTLARRIQPLLVLLARNEAVLEELNPGATVVRRSVAAADADLTGRELAVLALLAEGLTAEAIGRRLGVSRHTVRKHLEHLYRKLGVGDRLVAVREARARGILPEYDGARVSL